MDDTGRQLIAKGHLSDVDSGDLKHKKVTTQHYSGMQ